MSSIIAWIGALKEGLIDQETFDAAAKQLRVSDSFFGEQTRLGLVIDHPPKDNRSRTIEDQVCCERCGKVFVDTAAKARHILKKQCVPRPTAPPLRPQRGRGSLGRNRSSWTASVRG